jgi:transposase
MRVIGLPRSFYHFARGTPPTLSPKAQDRFRWLRCWQALRQQGLSCVAASEALGLPRSTLYRWQRNLKEHGPQDLETRRRRPRRRRQPTWTPELADAVLRLREQCPRWGKDKLVILLRRKRWQVSTSMVGRPHPSQSPRRPQRASQEGHRRPQAPQAAPLCGAQAQGVSGS